LPALENELLIWDDRGYVTENTHIRSLNFDTVKWAFFGFYANYWAPLTWLSLAVDYAFWELNPMGYHLTNNIIHAINAGIFFVLSYLLLKIYISAREPEKETSHVLTPNNALYCSLLAALLFALHPLRVESVAWVTERKDVLSLFFGLPAVISYLMHTQTATTRSLKANSVFSFAGSRYYWLSVAFYSLSLLSKPMFVTLPFVLLVLDWFPLRRFVSTGLRTLIYEKAPFLALALIDTFLVSMSNMPVIMSHAEITMVSRVLIAFKSILYYLWLTVWPADISPFYLHPGNIADIGIEYVLPILLFILVTFCCVRLVKRQPVFLVVLLLYMITLAPFMGFMHAGPQSMAARFTYLPGLPVALLYAIGTIAAFVRLSSSRIARIAIIVATISILVLAGCNTVKHIAFWKDDVTLFSRAIDLRPHHSGRVYFQRGLGYAKKGELQKALDDMNEALAIALAKNYHQHSIYVERARILRRMGNLEGAIADYSSAISNAEYPERRFYYERADTYKEMGRYDLAEKDFRHATITDVSK
jgi:tetratricopeptide (TPR) repeat protein